MKHARADYDRIQDPAGLIPEDEPVFLLRGQDRAAPSTLRHWADFALALGADGEMTGLAYDHADVMEKWQAAHGGRVPDLPSLLDLVHAPVSPVLETLRDAGDLIGLLRGCLRRLREEASHGSDAVWNADLLAEADGLLAGPILPIPLRPGETLRPGDVLPAPVRLGAPGDIFGTLRGDELVRAGDPAPGQTPSGPPLSHAEAARSVGVRGARYAIGVDPGAAGADRQVAAFFVDVTGVPEDALAGMLAGMNNAAARLRVPVPAGFHATKYPGEWQAEEGHRMACVRDVGGPGRPARPYARCWRGTGEGAFEDVPADTLAEAFESGRRFVYEDGEVLEAEEGPDGGR